MKRLEQACQDHVKKSHRYKILDWFEPLFKAAELLSQGASMALSAYPSPGSVALGGIVAVLQATSRLGRYQQLTWKYLSRMGRHARILMVYEKDVYNDDDAVQQALLDVYGDMIDFSVKACRFMLDEHGEIRAKVQGLSLIFFRDFESKLGDEVTRFEEHLENLDLYASLRDKIRIKELRNKHENWNHESSKLVKETQDLFNHNNDLLERLLRKDQDFQKRWSPPLLIFERTDEVFRTRTTRVRETSTETSPMAINTELSGHV
jgi:hypothetical protein